MSRLVALDRISYAAKVHGAMHAWEKSGTISDDQLATLAEYYEELYLRLLIVPDQFGTVMIDGVRGALQRVQDLQYRRENSAKEQFK